MPKKQDVGCAHPTGGVVGEKPSPEQKEAAPAAPEDKTMVQVGKKAPNFTAPCYYKGEFASVELSEYLGKWVLLCFYPGDFTFV